LTAVGDNAKARAEINRNPIPTFRWEIENRTVRMALIGGFVRKPPEF
jgi:hypothetical protein